MLTKTIQLFMEKDEEFVNHLIEICTQKNVAKMLVYLANIKEAISRKSNVGRTCASLSEHSNQIPG